jgi:hypothetical protein
MSNSAAEHSQAGRLVRRDRSPFTVQLAQWTDHRAWFSSCLLHTALLLAFAFFWQPQTRGTQGERDRPIGIAVLHETSSGERYSLSEASGTASTQASVAARSTSLAVNDAAGPPLSMEQILSSLTGDTNSQDLNTAANGSSGTGLTGDGSTSGNGAGVRGSGKTKTNFFGVEGTGNSFVYVVDRSDSMNVYEAGPLRSAKRELIKSLDSLNDYHQLQIVFYNETVLPLSPRGGMGRMVFATEQEKNRAISFVRAVRGDGGTEHLPALKLGLSYAPDVLFFLTDAEDPSLSQTQLSDIRSRAEISLTTIHAIQFNVGPAVGDGGWIRQLAETNRGVYKYVDVSELVPEP